MLAAVRGDDEKDELETLRTELARLTALRDGASAEPEVWLRDGLRRLIEAGLDRLPWPGSGATLQRWRALALVASHDLALVKLFESHTDALAILHELDPGHPPSARRAYAVWAAEGGPAPLALRESAAGAAIDGIKPWCSGAAVVDAALLTCAAASGKRHLVELQLRARGVSIDRGRWNAVGMRDSGSFDVACDSVDVRRVGAVNQYLERPGFWHGGIGVAACWYGAATAIGTRVRDLQRGRDDVHALAHLGAIDSALAAAGALLRECAADIDRAPSADASRAALRVRGFVADVAEEVIHHAGRAIGPGPLCNEAALARRIADLPIFIRQCRAEHDRVALARALTADSLETGAGWPL